MLCSLNAGAKTVPSLMTLRAFLNSSRGETATLPDELPVFYFIKLNCYLF